MRFDIRKTLVAIILASLGTLIACGGSGKGVSSPASSAQLSLSPAALTYAAVVGDGPYTVNVTASKGLPVASDTFTATSSNPAVASTTLNGSSVIISPVGVGTANIVFTSGAGVTHTIAATIAANKTQILLSPVALTYAARAGDASYSVSVKAVKSDGVTADTFTVASSNTAVTTTSVSANVVTIVPVGAGTANIVFTSGSNSKVTSTIAATIAANLTQLSLSPAGLTYTAVAGSTPYVVTVMAVKSDGVTADTFTVASSNTAIATTSVSGSVVTITPVAAGSANIVFTSGSSSKVTRTIAATISAATPSPQLTLAPPTLTYAAAVGDTPDSVTVTAIKNDGVTADTFTAISDDLTVATASQSGKVVTITPVAPGTASIVITSGDGLSKTIVATITTKASLSQLSLSPAALTYTAVPGDAPYPVTVTAVKNDGVTADTFTAVSSNPAAATASTSGSVVTITPVATGTTNILFTTGAGLTSTIAVTITGQSLSRCDGTEWFCDDFQEETVAGSAVSALTNWDLTAATGSGAFTVASDANVTGNKVLAYTAGNVNASVIGLIPDSVWQNAMGSHTGDYYVEARINVTKSAKNKQVYLLSRYQLASGIAEFYNSGLNFNGRSELGYAGNVKLAPSSPTGTAVGTWYTVRFEMIGKTAALYLNGVLQTLTVGGISNTSYTYPDANALSGGKVGLYADNNSFLIDDVRVGAVQLALTPNALAYSAAAGSSPYVVNITALMPDGVTADTFAVASDTPTVATATASGNVLTITPLQVGTANVTITSGSNSKVIRTIAVSVTAAATGTPQLTLLPAALTYNAVAGGTPYSVTITAIKNDGVAADTFSVASSSPAVASTSVSGNVVTITPIAAGTSNILFTTGSGLTSTISATITPNMAKITLSPASLTYSAIAGSVPYVVTVVAVKSDGTTADTFTVASSNIGVANTSVSGNAVTITAVAAGPANIVFTSGSGITSTIVATITANLANLTFSPVGMSYTTTAGGAPYNVTVTAVKSDGLTADTFTVASGNTAVATVVQTGNNVVITPIAMGTANIVFTSGSGVINTIVATVSTDLTQISLAPPAATYTAPVGSDPYLVTVTAFKSDGITADTYTVLSDNPAVATSVASGNQVTITPVSAGTANVVFTSSSKGSVTSTIAVTVTANLAQITLAPPALSYSAAANSTPHIVTVTAVKSDGTTADTFTSTVTPSDSSVVTAVAVGNVLTITPVAAGTASVAITTGSGITSTIAVTISAANYSGCDGTEWFCDDFQSGTSTNWILTPPVGGTTLSTFAVVPDINVTGNQVLQYTAGSTSGGVIALLTDAAWGTVTPHFVSNQADYYVEARIKPQINSTTGSKYLYMIGRYQSATNWYLGGLNVQATSSSSKAEAGFMKAGAVTRSVQQGATPSGIIMGTQGGTPIGSVGTDGQWYTVRLEMIGGVETLYMDGAKMGALTDSTWNTGKIGLYTANKSFLIDDVRVGDPSVKPVQLTIAPSALTYVAEAGDASYPVTVTAIKTDGTPDSFTALSSNSSVVNVSISGNVVTLSAVGAGTANIVFTSGSNPKLTRTIVATIAPQFIQSTNTYSLNGETEPAVGDAAAYIDGKLVLTFDSAPTLGTAGSIRIFKTSDDSLVDVIKMIGETDTIGLGCVTSPCNYRGVSTTPVWVSVNNVVIAPHMSKMAYNTSYYIAIANGAITGTLAGQEFTGIGKVGNWSFTTRSAPDDSKTTLTVNASGTTADFRSVQGALNYVMKHVPTTTPATINVMDGIYQELLYLRANSNVTIKGQSRTGTIIQYNNYESLNSGSGASATGTPVAGGGRALFLVESSDLLTLDTLTLKNTHLRSQVGSGQAETIYFNNDTGRLIAKNAEFYSEQDTLQLKGYNWFYNTLISGNVDFIWGSNRVSLFESSEIRTVGDSYYGITPSGGYVLQARTTTATDKGFIFLNSQLTYGTGPGGNTVATGTNAPAATYLARAAAGAWFDNVLYINCKLDTHITSMGWAALILGNPEPNPKTATATTGWREFGSMDMSGTLLNVTGRVATNSYQMTPTEINANYLNRAMIFSAFNSGAGWNPLP